MGTWNNAQCSAGMFDVGIHFVSDAPVLAIRRRRASCGLARAFRQAALWSHARQAGRCPEPKSVSCFGSRLFEAHGMEGPNRVDGRECEIVEESLKKVHSAPLFCHGRRTSREYESQTCFCGCAGTAVGRRGGRKHGSFRGWPGATGGVLGREDVQAGG